MPTSAKKGMLRTLVTTMSIPANVGRFLFFVPVIAILFVLAIEYALLVSVLTGNLPFSLFAQLFPYLVADLFITGGLVQTFHYVTIIILLSIYATLLSHILFQVRAFSISSFSTAALGLLGISIGISCLACGALLGTMLLSVAGATSATFIISQNSAIFFIAGEILLVVSIWLILRTIQKL